VSDSRNVRGSGGMWEEQEEECERNRWNMIGTGGM